MPPPDTRRYRRLLRFFFPAEVVRRNGEEMEATFLRLLELERSRRGRRGAVVAWLRAVVDGIWNGWLRRRGASPGGGRAGRWGGAGVSWLDVKLGLRMLVKQPGLTLVAVFGLAVGIPVGLAPSHAARAFETPPPYPEPHELQVLGSINVETSRRESPSLDPGRSPSRPPRYPLG